MAEDRTPTSPTESLGRLLHEHAPRRTRRRAFLIAAIAALAVSGVVLAFGVWRWYFAYTTFGPLVVWRWSWTWLAAGGALAGLGAFLVLGAWRQRWPIVRTFQKGVAVLHGRSFARHRWDEMESLRTNSVHYGLKRLGWQGQAEISLLLRDGRRLTLTNALSEFDLLVETIKRNLYPTLMARYTQSFNRGESLHFGPFTLTPQGVLQERGVTPWAAIGQAMLKDGSLILVPTERSGLTQVKVPAHKVPNVDLCVQLLQQLGRRT